MRWIICCCHIGHLYDFVRMRNLAQKLIKKLIRKGLKISFAESCTGGLLSSTITSINGSSRVFEMGLVTYSNKSKTKLLDVSKKTISQFGAVSWETCFSMVNNLSKISKSDINISITGIAGPKGGTRLKPVGLVYIGIKKGKKVIIKKNFFKVANRLSIQKMTVKKSLNMMNEIV